MAVIRGKNGRVTLDTNVVAELTDWDMDGLTNEVIESDAFERQFKDFHYGVGDWGSANFKGNFNLSDASGQMSLCLAAQNQVKVTTLKFQLDSYGTSYYGISDATAYALITKAHAVTMDKSGVGTIAFSVKLSGPWKFT